MGGVIELVHIEVAIQVVVKKYSLGTITNKVESVLSRLLFIYRYTIFDGFAHIKLVVAFKHIKGAHLANVNIHHAVIVDVNHTDPV